MKQCCSFSVSVFNVFILGVQMKNDKNAYLNNDS
jgi:hypothetical protein